MNKNRIIRAATIGLSLNIFCKDLLQEMKAQGYDVLALSSPDDDLRQLGEREGVRTIGIEMDRRMSPSKDLNALWQIYRAFRREKPQMVHSMTPKAGLLCMIAAWLARVPIRVHTFTGLIWPTATGNTRRLLMLTDRLTCACATHVIPEGQGVMDDLRNGGITHKPMRVLGYGNIRGVDLDKYSRRPEVMQLAQKLIVPDTFHFVFIGRIVGDKGINELVAAYYRLIEKYPTRKFKLSLIGWMEDKIDPISAESRRLIAECPSIEIVGETFGDDLLAYYAACDCFIFPSYREGFPNTVIEAGAMDLPSIVTDINGAREIVVPYDKHPDEATGLIIPSKNVEALFDAMDWMFTHDKERQEMGARARQHVAQRWEQSYVRSCLLEFYRQCLN